MGRLCGLVLLVGVSGGCSSGITGPADMQVAVDDLPAFPTDMAPGCMLAFSGAVNMTLPCNIFLCHPTGGSDDYDSLALVTPGSNPTQSHANWDVDHMFELRSYTAAQLRSVDIATFVNGTRYQAMPDDAVSLTVTGMTRPSAMPCDGVAHGSATATLDELAVDDGGMTTSGPGRVTLNATF